jgi:peptide/nickel transport system ATP-binding protein
LLQIHDLHLSFGDKEVLKGIDLELNKGEILAVVGESGAGKTTLGLSLGGLIGRENPAAGRSQKGGQAKGQILFQGQNILSLPEEELRKLRWNKISFVFQNVPNALNPVLPILEQVAEPYWVHGIGTRFQAKERAREMLELVHFPQAKGLNYPHELSGGEIQRALIAMALINEPELLVLDEPTASLDPLTRREIAKLLTKVTQNCAVLLITHDLSLASVLSTRVAVLYKGRILEEGSTEKVLQTPHHPYMRALLRSYPHMSTSKDLQSINLTLEEPLQGCAFRPRCSQAIEICAHSSPPLLEFNLSLGTGLSEDPIAPRPLNIASKVACHRGGIIPYLVAHRLAKQYDRDFSLQETSFIIFEGETVALVGQSGSGKSTLAKLIIGLEKADQGRVLLEEEQVPFPRDQKFLRRVQLIFQNPYEAVNPRMTIREIVTEPLVIQKIGQEKERQDKVLRVLEEVGLPQSNAFLQSFPGTLSGGELQRLVIARSLILEPKLLIADEPTSALDALVQARILKLLMELQEKRGLGMLFITHDIALARKIADRILVIKNGVIVEQGLSWEITTRPRHPYTKRLLEAAAAI